MFSRGKIDAMRNINQQQLVGILMGVLGAKAVSFSAKTKANVRKTPYGDIFKLSRVNGMVGFQYDDGVVRRLAKEGKTDADFRRGESWHEPVVDDQGRLTPLCVNKKSDGKGYLRFMYRKTLGEPRYFGADGEELTQSQVEPYLRKSSNYENQCLDKPLEIKVYALENLLSISVDGQSYEMSESLADVTGRRIWEALREEAKVEA